MSDRHPDPKIGPQVYLGPIKIMMPEPMKTSPQAKRHHDGEDGEGDKDYTNEEGGEDDEEYDENDEYDEDDTEDKSYLVIREGCRKKP